MPDNTLDSSYFTDLDDLDSYMRDKRAADTLTKSSKESAHEFITEFRQTDGESAWRSLSRDKVADRLDVIVDDARQIQQGKLNLCGPASLMCCWSARDPLAFARYACNLFNDGSSMIGTLEVAPSSELLEQDLSALPDIDTDPADWMFLGALRNTTNVFWQGSWVGDPEQMAAGLTRPEELADWLNATGIYKTVRNEANWMTPAGIPHASNLNMAEGDDIIILLNTNMISAVDKEKRPFDDTFLLNQFPNHYVVLLSEIIPHIDNSHVLLSIWTWAQNKVNLEVPKQAFIDNYYGALIATLAD